MKRFKKLDGFSLIEFILIICILMLMFGMAFLTIQSREQQQKEDLLKQGLEEVRFALRNYYSDHKHFPCSKEDFNRNADYEVFVKQLTWFTNIQGEPSHTRSRNYRFGPYLKSLPVESITQSHSVYVDTISVVDLITLKKKVVESEKATGGWYYQAENGFFLANLNKNRFKDYYAYF